jgi:hypothetical protein
MELEHAMEYARSRHPRHEGDTSDASEEFGEDELIALQARVSFELSST